MAARRRTNSVVRAVGDLKARGLSVVFYPFLFMDIAEGNVLPDPWTGNAGQPVYPWRGRITCDPAPGQPGTVDKTGTATGQIGNFFGSVTRSQISVSVNGTINAVTTSYSGPTEWSFRRFILHYAKLCGAINAIEPNAIDGFIIGSEPRQHDADLLLGRMLLARAPPDIPDRPVGGILGINRVPSHRLPPDWKR